MELARSVPGPDEAHACMERSGTWQETSWGMLGAFWSVPEACLERPGACQEHAWSVLERVRSMLGAFQEHVWSVLEHARSMPGFGVERAV